MDLFIKIKKLDHFIENSELKYATEHSSGFDLIASIDKDIPVKPMERVIVPTGIMIAISQNEYEAQVRSRSGLAAKHGIAVLNSPGTIDNDYRGEIKVILINFGSEEFIITPGMRIAQLVIAQYKKVDFKFVENLNDEDTVRGECGFGSTGTH